MRAESERGGIEFEFEFRDAADAGEEKVRVLSSRARAWGMELTGLGWPNRVGCPNGPSSDAVTRPEYGPGLGPFKLGRWIC